MTRRSPSAPRQVELTQSLSAKINESPFLFISDDELTTGSIVTDGDWLNRVCTFLDDPESGVGSDEIEREWATAMITRRYKRHLSRRLVARLTKCLQPVKQYPPGSREERLAKVKRDIKKVEHDLDEVLEGLTKDQLTELVIAMSNQALSVFRQRIGKLIESGEVECLEDDGYLNMIHDEVDRACLATVGDCILKWLKDQGLVAKDFVPDEEIS